MQFTTLALAAFASFVAAEDGFTVPGGTPNGVYSVYRADNGTEVHEPVDTRFSAKFARRVDSLLTKKDTIPAGVVTCGGSKGLNPGDTDQANAALDAQCGGWTQVKAGLHFYSVIGGTVAFFCNYANHDYGCSNGARAQYSSEVTAACGAYNSGWVLEEDGIQGYGGQNYAYGYDVSSSAFCGCGTRC